MLVQLDPCSVPSECTDVVRTNYPTSTQRTLTCHYCISDKRPVGGRYCLKRYIWLFHVFHVFLLVGGLGGMFLFSLSLPSSFRSLTCCSSDMFFFLMALLTDGAVPGMASRIQRSFLVYVFIGCVWTAVIAHSAGVVVCA